MKVLNIDANRCVFNYDGRCNLMVKYCDAADEEDCASYQEDKYGKGKAEFA